MYGTGCLHKSCISSSHFQGQYKGLNIKKKHPHYHLLRHFIIHFSLTQQSQESIKLRGKLAKQDGVWERWLLTERLFRALKALRLGEGEELSLTHRETAYILLFHFGVGVNSGLQ